MDRKKIFEVYGLSRLVLGICQLVGISAGFFLKEWILKYPQGSSSVILDQEMITLVYLAVILRGVFHIIVGIGISRLRDWARFWIVGGWPIIILIVFGLASSFTVGWREAGLLVEFVSVISWGKVFLLALLVGFDLFFIIPAIRNMNVAAVKHGKKVERIENQSIIVLCLMITFGLSVLLFMGRTITKGFHPGFYKTRQTTAVLKRQDLGITSRDDKKDLRALGGTKAALVKKDFSKEGKSVESVDQPSQMVPRTRIEDAGGVIDPTAPFKNPQTRVGVKVDSVKVWPVRLIVVVFGVGCLLCGFLFQIFEIVKTKSAHNVALSSYCLFIASFLCGGVYGLSTKNLGLTVLCFLLLVLCSFTIWLKGQYDEA